MNDISFRSLPPSWRKLSLVWLLSSKTSKSKTKFKTLKLFLTFHLFQKTGETQILIYKTVEFSRKKLKNKFDFSEAPHVPCFRSKLRKNKRIIIIHCFYFFVTKFWLKFFQSRRINIRFEKIKSVLIWLDGAYHHLGRMECKSQCCQLFSQLRSRSPF